MRRLILGLFLVLSWTDSAEAANFYVRSSSSSTWVASTAYALGNRVVATTAATAAKQALVFECTTAGTSAITEPAWNETVGGTTTDNTVTWTTRQATTWANAHAFLARLLGNASGGVTASDIVWVSDAHAESQTTAMTLTFPTTQGLRVLCGDDVAEPPTELATTCSVSIGAGSVGISFASGFAYLYGITFNGATNNSASSDVSFGSGVKYVFTLDTCVLNVRTANAAGSVNLGTGGSSTIDDAAITLINPTFKFGGVGNAIEFGHGRIHIIGATLDNTGSAPTTLFEYTNSVGLHALVESSDLSALSFTNLATAAGSSTGTLTIRNTRLPAGINVTTGTSPGPGAIQVKMHNCDSADTNYRFSENKYEGSTIQETTIVRTGGASDGTTPISWEMASSANTNFWTPLVSPEIVQWNETTGSALTVTVEFVYDSLTNAQDDEIWLEVDSLNTSGVPQGTRTSDRMTNILSTAADQTDSTVAWTTTGLTNPNTQKLSVSITPQEKGYLHGRIMVANPSTTYYINPTLDVTQ